MSLALLFHYLLLNMFRMLVHPSSGARDTPTHIEPEQYNTWNKSTISRKLLKMVVLTFETSWAVNNEIIKQVISSWTWVYMHISDCVQTAYELPSLPNNTAVKHFYTNRDGSMFSLDVSQWVAGLAVTGRIGEIGWYVLQSALKQEALASTVNCQIFFLIAFLCVAFIRNILH